MLLTSFVAHLCTFSSPMVSFLKTGDHTEDAYSMCGRTIDLNKLNRFKNISLSRNVRNMRPKFLFAKDSHSL